MTTRKYSSRSQQTTLTAGINSTAASATVVSGSALLGGVTVSPGETFTVVIDPDTALEEIVDVTAVSTNTLTILRNIDGSTGQAHSAGAVVRHMAIGRDYREANTHIEGNLTGHAATTSAQLASVISDETGTGSLVFATNPALVTPTIDGLSVQEKVEDIVGAMVTGNTESGIAVTYDDTAGKLNFDVNDPTITISGDVAGSATMTNLGNTTISTAISAGAIVDADVNAAAAIAKTKISGTAITAADTGTVTSLMIADGAIVNGDINSSAQIAYSKTNLTNSIVDADVNASAAIAWSKIAPSSTVSATELGYLDGVTSAVQTQIDSKLATSTAASTYAPLASPALTGVPTAPTATAGTNTTQVATTAFVGTAVSNLVAAAPAALDTLNELAASLGNDANFATTVTNNLATKLPLAGGTMSGAIAMGTNKITGMGTPTVSTDAATKGYVDTVTVAPSNLTGPITSVGSATSVASQTGTGSIFVMNTSPTLVTPVLGVATATSINGTTIPTSKTLVATDSTAYVVPSQTGNAGKFLTTDGTTSSWNGAVSTSGGSTITASGAAVIPIILKGTTSQTGDLLQVQNSASTKLVVIDAAGNVGIGLAAPNADLHIHSTTTVSDFRMSNSAASTVMNMYTTSNDFVLQNATATGSLYFGTNGTNDITIGPNGNIAFGTTPTSASLIIQAQNTTGSNTGQVIINKFTGTAASPTESNDWPEPILNLRGYGNYGQESMLSFGYSNDATYQTADGVWAFKLEGTASATSSTSATNLRVGGPGALLVSTAGAERFKVDNAGNLAIGSNTASNFNGLRYFDIYNQDGTSSSGAIIRLITQQSGSTALTSVDMVKYKNGNFVIQNNDTAGSLNLGTGTGSDLTIASDGATTVSYTTTTGGAVRNIWMSTAAPSGGNDGDVWIKYV